MTSILLYISAAGDLDAERDGLARAVTEIPVSLGWRIIQSPLRHEPVDFEAIRQADVHLLLLGSDIRAPIGLEWVIARQAGRSPIPFLKQDSLRTPAAQRFVAYIESQAAWRPFKSGTDLRQAVLTLLSDTILDHAVAYGLTLAELERLQLWRTQLETAPPRPDEDVRGGAGESSIIFSGEQLAASGGVLIRQRKPDDQ